jgi:hypothetical protein
MLLLIGLLTLFFILSLFRMIQLYKFIVKKNYDPTLNNLEGDYINFLNNLNKKMDLPPPRIYQDDS